MVEPGTVVEAEKWLKPAIKGMVTGVYTNKSGGIGGTVAIYKNSLAGGDKLANGTGSNSRSDL